MDDRKYSIVVLLLTLIIILLVMLLFKDPILDFIKFSRIKSQSSLFNIPSYFGSCRSSYEDWNEEVDVLPTLSPQCQYAQEAGEKDKERWDKLIDLKKDLDCSDFENDWDATHFLWYINNKREIYKCVDYKQFIDGDYKDTFFMSADCKCNYDPYGIDADNDCIACEKN